MSKQLTPLEVYKRIILCSIYDYDEIKEDTKIVESELRRLEEHDRIFKEYDIDDNWLDLALYVIKNHFPMDTETQLMKLTAFDIIKEKRVNVDWLLEVDFDLERYNRHIAPFHRYDLNTMEIKILKEALK